MPIFQLKRKSIFIGLFIGANMLQVFHANAQSHADKVKARAKIFSDSLNADRQRQADAAIKRRQRMTNKNNQAVFGDDDPIFRETQIPDKWKDQSAVMLACKTTYHYYTKGTSACFDRIERKRIKMLDKSAVDNLSTFYFIPTNDVGFTLIKKDGTTTNINLNDAVPVDKYIPVPSSYIVQGSVNYTYSKSYKKIVISGLEPGDIIDYYYKYSSSTYKDGFLAVPFPAVALTLTGEYPVVAQKIKLQAETGFYVNFSSYNGASELARVVDTTVNSNTYLLNDTNRNKWKDERWEYPFRCEPSIKFQVVYSTDKNKEEAPYFLGSSSSPTTSVSQDQLKKVANEVALQTTPSIEKYSSAIISFMKKNHGNIKDPVLYMKYAYTYFRYFLMIGNIEDGDGSNFSGDIDQNLQEKYVIESDVFAKTLSLVCRDKKIDYDILMGVPRNMGTLDKLVYPSELKWILHIKGAQDVYLYPFDSYRVPGEASEGMEGIDMYTLLPDKKIEKVMMDRAKTPVTGDADNIAFLNARITLNTDMQGGASVERKVQVAGLLKEQYYSDVIAVTQLLAQELKRYNEITLEEYLKKTQNKSKKQEQERKIASAIADEQKERVETMKTFFMSDFDVNSYDDFELLCDGRQVDSAKLMFADKFKLKDVVHKVGQNYIVDAGKFIGKQLELKEEQLTRTDDVYLRYAGEFDNEVNITIPNGYVVQGTDALNKSVINQAGGFVSTASISGNTLTIKTRKFYLHNFEPKENWPDMVKFVEAAYDFTQAKILLKKA